MAKRRLTLDVSTETRERLEKLSAARGTTMTATVVDALRLYDRYLR